MKTWLHHWPSLFTPAECEAIKRFASSLPENTATVGYGGQNRVDSELRRSEVRWLSRSERRLDAVTFRVMDAAERVNNDKFGFDLRGFDSIQFTTYRAENAGHYDWHEDLAWVSDKEVCRKLSCVILLSSPLDFDGGGLEFQRQKAQPALAQGDAIFFPSFHHHRVLPVTRGVRQTLVTWFNGPSFR